MDQSGSSSKFQCDRLFGSFQNIAASSMRTPSAADVDLLLGLVEDFESSAAQHRFGAGPVGDPPIGGIVRVALLDEVHCGESGLIEYVRFEKRIVLLDCRHPRAAAEESLEDQQIPHHVLLKKIEREQRMAQVVEHAQKQNHIELFVQLGD